MQSGIAAADRKLLGIAGAVGLALIAGSVAFAPVESSPGLEPPSTYSSGAGGARAAYLLLLDLGYRVERWEEPPAGLANVAASGTLILAEPTVMPTEHERRALVEFVRNGGRLIFCGNTLREFFPEASVNGTIFSLDEREFSSLLPSELSRNADRVVMRPQAYWDKLGPAQLALYADGQSTAVVAWRIGNGEVLWWAGATPLTNAGIRRAGNLNLFLNAVSAGDGEPRWIYWDEYFHGERGSLLTYVEKTPLLWGVLQIALVFGGLLFTFSRRSGPIAAPATVSRLSPLEFIDTMGGLYQRAGAQSIAVAISYRHLRLELARRLGLPVAIPDSDLAQAAHDRLGVDNGVAHALAEAAQLGGSLKPAAALLLVKRLATYDAQLKAPRPFAQETN
jgi:hypothetical protein